MYVFKELNESLNNTLFTLTGEMIKKKERFTKKVYEDIAKYIIPERETLFHEKQQGQSFGEDIYNGWPGYCHRKMTNSMYGNLCPRNTNWMSLSLGNKAKPPRIITEELQKLNRSLMLLLDKSNFYGNQTQFISDGVGFGNGLQYVKDDIIDKKTKFLGIHPAQYYVDTDDDGDVKSILRKTSISYIDIIRIIKSSPMKDSENYEKYIPDEIEREIKNGTYFSSIDVCHFTMKAKYYKDAIELPAEYIGEFDYVSVWYFSSNGKSGEVFCIDRYQEFPYIHWSFNQETGWDYGFGPGHYALHDAKVLQQHGRARIEAAQRAAAPPLQIPEELKNKVNNRPYGNTYYEDSSRLVQGLYQQVNFPISTEVTKEIKEIIGFHYMLDVWQTLSDITARMTAYEVAERLGEKMASVSAVVGNFLNQGLTQQMKRFISIEEKAGRIKVSKNLKEYMVKEGVDIEYHSLLAQAVKKHLENQGLMRTINEMQMVFELNPEFTAAFNWYNVGVHMIDGNSLMSDILIDEKDYKKILEENRKMKQMEAQAAMMQKEGQGGTQGVVR